MQTIQINSKEDLGELIHEQKLRKSRGNLLNFTKNTLEGFEVEPYHKAYYTLLDAFAKGKIKRLMVTMPPQHGKSEGSTRRLPAYMLGLNPNLKLAIASYNSTFASKFNRDTQRIIDDSFYTEVFPQTTLMGTGVKADNNYLRNTSEFEIVGKTGGLKSVGRGGALTGNKVDVMIMDDLYKDYMEANSPIIRRDSVWDWYTTVVDSRLHNNSQQLIVFTRWHEEDLIGRLETLGKVKTINSLEDIDNIE